MLAHKTAWRSHTNWEDATWTSVLESITQRFPVWFRRLLTAFNPPDTELMALQLMLCIHALERHIHTHLKTVCRHSSHLNQCKVYAHLDTLEQLNSCTDLHANTHSGIPPCHFFMTVVWRLLFPCAWGIQSRGAYETPHQGAEADPITAIITAPYAPNTAKSY